MVLGLSSWSPSQWKKDLESGFYPTLVKSGVKWTLVKSPGLYKTMCQQCSYNGLLIAYHDGVQWLQWYDVIASSAYIYSMDPPLFIASPFPSQIAMHSCSTGIHVQSQASLASWHTSLVGYSESYIRSQMGVVMCLAFSSAICPGIVILSNPEMALLQRDRMLACGGDTTWQCSRYRRCDCTEGSHCWRFQRGHFGR